MWFCDNCKDLIATQRVVYGFLVEKHLSPMAAQEWCNDCVDNFRRDLRTDPDVHNTEYEHGK